MRYIICIDIYATLNHRLHVELSLKLQYLLSFYLKKKVLSCLLFGFTQQRGHVPFLGWQCTLFLAAPRLIHGQTPLNSHYDIRKHCYVSEHTTTWCGKPLMETILVSNGYHNKGLICRFVLLALMVLFS